MSFLSQVGLVPFTALVADPMFPTDQDGDSGIRTIVGALVIVGLLGLIVFIATAMGRGQRA